MLLLAVDTATPAVTAGLAELTPTGLRLLASRIVVDPRAHAELLTPLILQCLQQAGQTPTDLDAIVTGLGPGPFTGLRAGIATAAAFGDALGIPVHGVCSLDAIAHDVSAASTVRELLIVTDARRREVYWARYQNNVRVAGPAVNKPADIEVGSARAIAGSASHVDYFDLRVEPAETPSPLGLVRSALRNGALPASTTPLAPLYLRRPDAVAPPLAAV